MSFTAVIDEFFYFHFANELHLRDVIYEFVNEMPSRIESLARAFTSAEWYTLRRLAHQRQGADGSYGFDPVSQTAVRLEQVRVNTRPAAEIKAALRALTDIGQRVRGEGSLALRN